ncbi:MAG: efflux RND transporter periplasmic adaptor subunit [Alphaproteobacteria bacterium]|nr:efflux RND transporter periplasmic adaptor subunit [Alphaproteobacteria bacterium]MBU1549431.1 efflux RND transporter periplasmic adaptor subunit [Alphaproteobacteria bacterium]MBU2338196.1 efflux RND transporter periplasmic adaptor subunit [Alphaproteobacteria bacterium]MBU2387583.1 efflux RND transporter periplasmic adaptor subunit [Alphaproteobacteria bacterium]
MNKILLVCLLASAAAISSCSDEQKPAAPAARVVDVVSVKATPLVRGGEITGVVRARVQTDLSFRVSGKVVERLADVGETVKAGQILARIDPEEQRAELEIAEANLRTAEAQQTQAELAFQRQQNLFRTQVTTRAALEQAQEALATAHGSAKSAQALLQNAQEALSYTELKADSDGVITARNAEVGQVAQAAQVMFTLAHAGEQDAVFDVVESLFLGPEVDPAATVSLLSDPTRSIEAKVREVSPTIDQSSGTVRVKVAVSSDDPLPLGAPVVGRFRYKPRDVFELPASAMSSKAGRPAVWIVDPATSRAKPKSIEVGDYGTSSFVVASGVSAGDIVVSQGVKFLRPGEKVAYDLEAAK